MFVTEVSERSASKSHRQIEKVHHAWKSIFRQWMAWPDMHGMTRSIWMHFAIMIRIKWDLPRTTLFVGTDAKHQWISVFSMNTPLDRGLRFLVCNLNVEHFLMEILNGRLGLECSWALGKLTLDLPFCRNNQSLTTPLAMDEHSMHNTSSLPRSGPVHEQPRKTSSVQSPHPRSPLGMSNQGTTTSP